MQRFGAKLWTGFKKIGPKLFLDLYDDPRVRWQGRGSSMSREQFVRENSELQISQNTQ